MSIHQSLSQKCLKQIIDLEVKIKELQTENTKLLKANKSLEASVSRQNAEIDDKQNQLMLDFTMHNEVSDAPAKKYMHKRHNSEIQILRRMSMASNSQYKDINDLKMDLQVDLVWRCKNT